MWMRLLGRSFLSIMFIIFGAFALYNWDESYTELDAAVVNWQMFKGNFESIGTFLDILTSYIAVLLGMGIFLYIVGGLMVLFSFFEKLGAFLLILGIVCSTLIYFPFWFYQGEQMHSNLVLFLKNLALLGGLFLLLSGNKINDRQVIVHDEL